MIDRHFCIECEPVAHPAAVVEIAGARFTVLTTRLIRMEYSASQSFEDRASQVFWHRRQPVPPFTVTTSDESLEIDTGELRLRYMLRPLGFRRATLSIEVRETGAVWRFGDDNADNLLGTARTLDQTNGRVRMERGLMARSGWTVVDDSGSLVFNEGSWLQACPERRTDLYFFGYGHHYQDCLRDYCKVAGPVPMIPRWILGNWWSRYWAYTQDELQQVVEDFRSHGIPLAVCIIDMDWHITKTGNTSTGWTGFTWNKDLFPEPYGFVRWLHEQGVHTAMNLHPAEGVHPHEAQFTEIATAMGVDPAAQKPVPFDIADPAFTRAYFQLLLHPMEEQGVDFWWMDWQQGTMSKLPGLDPLWWLNHLHFLDRGRDGKKRPFVFSRWGGLGNHRYPIGFSGDTVVTWDSLAFQPYFTATAANVNFGWWSHDIGGHMRGMEDPELYARWVQFGLFSPVLRLHSTNNPYHDRRPWANGEEAFHVARTAMQLRHAFIPYIYSMAWRNHQNCLPLVAPMYHAYPESEPAYHCPNQYLFGSELLAAPFVQKRNAETGLSRQAVWLPEGDWFDFFTGEHYAGGGWSAVYGTLQDVPVFAKAGAIVPLGPRVTWGGIGNPAELDLHVFAGADGRFDLYEDDGDSTAYTSGTHCLTTFSQTWEDQRLTLSIHPATGDAGQAPPQRTYRLLVHGVRQPDEMTVTVNGAPLLLASTYDGRERLECSGLVLTPASGATITLSVASGSLFSRRDRTAEKVRAMLRHFRLESRAKAAIDAQLAAITTDVDHLGDFCMDLHEAQTFALVEVIRKTALDH